MGWPIKLAFVALTLVNLALVLLGAWLTLWMPMLFDSGSTQDKVLVATAVSIVLFLRTLAVAVPMAPMAPRRRRDGDPADRHSRRRSAFRELER